MKHSGQVKPVIVFCPKCGVALWTLPLSSFITCFETLQTKDVETLGQYCVLPLHFARRTRQLLLKRNLVTFNQTNKIEASISQCFNIAKSQSEESCLNPICTLYSLISSIKTSSAELAISIFFARSIFFRKLATSS